MKLLAVLLCIFIFLFFCSSDKKQIEPGIAFFQVRYEMDCSDTYELETMYGGSNRHYKNLSGKVTVEELYQNCFSTLCFAVIAGQIGKESSIRFKLFVDNRLVYEKNVIGEMIFFAGCHKVQTGEGKDGKDK